MISDVEDRVNTEFVWVLDKIRENQLKTVNGTSVKYWTSDRAFIGGNVPLPSDEIRILEKLEADGAIRILNPGGTGEYE